MMKHMRSLGALSLTAAVVATGAAVAQQKITVDITKISSAGIGDKVGTIVVSQSKNGVSFNIDVRGLPEGQHGFHVHENGNCGPVVKDGKATAGLAAGAHYDPDQSHSHKGPHGTGHKGDLPVLKGTDKGISETVTAPRLKLSDVVGRALVIHEAGDNYGDQPENGGGKGRIACGVVPKQ
jgi:Cu-Zn family superoxide dismutase